MSETLFKTRYAELNPKQREAVDEIQGPMMVIAGPGTGKTSILTLRIANILKKTDTPPDAILALTFTESGAFSMRRKLVELIGAAAYRVTILTFHGFANHVIRRYSESFPRIAGSRSATAADQLRILERIFLKTKFKLIRPFGDIFHYVPKALRAIRELKRENVSPTAFRKALAREEHAAKKAPDRLHRAGRFKGELKADYRDLFRKLEKSKELAEVYAKYEAALKKERLFDFEDMILEVIRALEKDKNLLLSLQEQYHSILADEHQDANNAQNRILELLSSFDDSPNLFVVGDEKQAIYRFQGASLENFLYFKRLYPRARLVSLAENYRSTQAILDASHSLMAQGALTDSIPRELLRPRLWGRSAGAKTNIRFSEFSKASLEVAFVVSDIETRLSAGTRPHEVAVLFRNNEDALPFVEAFERTSVRFLVLADEDILKDQELSKLLHILRAVAEPGNEQLFAEMLHLEFFGIPPITLYSFLRFVHEKRLSSLYALGHKELRTRVPANDVRKLASVFADFSRWASLARNKSAGEAVETIARESGFVAYLLRQRGSLRALEKLDRLFAHLKELSEREREFRLADFLETLERLSRHGVRLGGTALRPELLESVTLMTAHRAKGLEFSCVYIVNAVDGRWGGRRASSDFYIPLTKGGAESTRRGLLPLTPFIKGDEDEDERRLFFVALTRAKKEVIITMAREGSEGRQALPSQFIEAIDRELISREDTREIERRLSAQESLYLRPRENTGPSITLKDYLQKLFLEQGLTVTALNNYLSCPWEYFFKNLVRLPQLPASYLSYGTAVHEALHGFFNRYRERRVGKTELLRLFDKAIERSPLPLREFREYKERGRTALAGYFDARKDSFVKDTLNEFEVTGVFVPLGKSSALTDSGTSFGKGGITDNMESYSPFPKGSTRRGRDFIPLLLLRGKLDKIERFPDGTVRVVDYKTGLPKTRAQVAGETKNSDGNLKRQLDFYKLLLDGGGRGNRSQTPPSSRFNLKSGKRLNLAPHLRMVSGVIDFIEPDKKGTYHREEFEVGERDVAALRTEIQRVGAEIYSLSFWDRRCGDRTCEYCKLRGMLN